MACRLEGGIEPGIESTEPETVTIIKPAGGNVIGLCFETQAGQVLPVCPMNHFIHQQTANTFATGYAVNGKVIDLGIVVPASGGQKVAADQIVFAGNQKNAFRRG